MTTTSSPKLVTAEELLELSANGFYGELVRGELVELMPPGTRHGKVMALVTYVLMSFVLPRSLGTVLTGDPGVVTERGPDTVRAPDIAYYAAERMGLDEEIPGYAELPPDFVVEIRSPNDSLTSMERRAQMWLGYGVQMVWVLLPESRRLDIYRPDSETASLTAESYVGGEDILPEFSCRVGDLFGPAAQADEPAAR